MLFDNDVPERIKLVKRFVKVAQVSIVGITIHLYIFESYFIIGMLSTSEFCNNYLNYEGAARA